MTTMRRQLGLADAVWIGLGSMIGAGVFSAFAPAAAAAGAGLMIGLALAAAVAWCNASSSAQLAIAYPRAGGTYLYGREVLGPWPGFIAGWGFVIGKTASCAAMAMTAAAYAAPGHERAAAAALVVALTAVNCAGVTRTAAVARMIVVAVVGVLIALVAFAAPSASVDGLAGWLDPRDGAYGVLQAAGLLFFAFAGYARIATLGEEVRDPARVIPRAILVALAIAVAVYAVLAAACLMVLGPQQLAASTAPLSDLAAAAGRPDLRPLVRAAGALAASGALLALGAGVGRTALAMARERDLPAALAAIHPRTGVPHRAEILVGAVVVALVLSTDLRGAIGFSSFGVLVYYLVANAAAFAQPGSERRTPRLVQVLGALGCATLAVTLPVSAVVAGIAVIAIGLAIRAGRVLRTG